MHHLAVYNFCLIDFINMIDFFIIFILKGGKIV